VSVSTQDGLRSVGAHRRPVLPHEGRPTPKGDGPTNLRITARGGHFYLRPRAVQLAIDTRSCAVSLSITADTRLQPIPNLVITLGR
jgi:hypothetical protein